MATGASSIVFLRSQDGSLTLICPPETIAAR